MLIKKYPVRKKESEYRRRKYVSYEEFKKLYHGRVQGKRESPKRILRHKVILSLLYYHGLRRQELCDLQWSDIDWNAGAITIRRKKRGKYSVHPLVRGEKALLKAYYDLTAEWSGYVIDVPNYPTSKKASPSCINCFFARLNRQEILPIKLTPHMFRHGCGFYLANKGVDTRTIQVYLGHSSIQSTAIYTELAPSRFLNLFD